MGLFNTTLGRQPSGEKYMVKAVNRKILNTMQKIQTTKYNTK